jgi:hypothetical protein
MPCAPLGRCLGCSWAEAATLARIGKTSKIRCGLSRGRRCRHLGNRQAAALQSIASDYTASASSHYIRLGTNRAISAAPHRAAQLRIFGAEEIGLSALSPFIAPAGWHITQIRRITFPFPAQPRLRLPVCIVGLVLRARIRPLRSYHPTGDRKSHGQDLVDAASIEINNFEPPARYLYRFTRFCKRPKWARTKPATV